MERIFYVTSLNFTRVMIREEDITKLLSILTQITSLKSVDFGNNDVRKESIQELANKLPNCRVCASRRTYVAQKRKIYCKSSSMPPDSLKINNSQYDSDDSGYPSSVNTSERRQSQEYVTTTSTNKGLFQSTPIKPPKNCNLSMISKPQEQNINSVISEVDKYVQNNNLQEDCESQFRERSELIDVKNESSKLNSDEQEAKDLSRTIKVINQSKDDSFKQDQYYGKDKKSYIFNCVAGGGIGLAVAYFA